MKKKMKACEQDGGLFESSPQGPSTSGNTTPTFPMFRSLFIERKYKQTKKEAQKK
jgi:hypothetical protein